MPPLVSRRSLVQEIQDVATDLHTYTPSTVLHECLKRRVITAKMLATWGNSAGEQRVKAALKHEIAPGVPFSGVIAWTKQGEFTWTTVDSMGFDEYRAFLRHNQENAGRDVLKIRQQQRWGRDKFGDRYEVDTYEEFSPAWMQRYLVMADELDLGDPSDPDGEEDA